MALLLRDELDQDMSYVASFRTERVAGTRRPQP